MADFAWKQGDTDPLEVELQSDHATSWTLDGSVVFNMKKQGATTLIVSRGACEIIDGSAHTVRFRPSAVQTNQVPGNYSCEFEWTDGNGTIRTFPTGKDDEPDFFMVNIVGQLA